MSKFFINRPIFAFVLSLLFLLVGGVSLTTLPVALYPEITPPTVVVTASYPGANAEVIAETVAEPIEDKVNGVEDMLYMTSTSSSAGVYSLTVTFAIGTDTDMATVLVQNRVAQATSSLPDAVTRLGVTTKKKSTGILNMIVLTSDKPELYNDVYLANYANLNIIDEIKRVNGVGDVNPFGADVYSMRMWLDPDLLRIRDLTPSDVIAAIEEQSVQVSAGKIGELPSTNKESFQYTLDIKGRLTSKEEFGNIIIKALPSGQYLRIKDVAQIELGSQSYTLESKLNGRPAASLTVYQLPDANSIEVANEVRAKVEDMQSNLPEGVNIEVVLDTTEYVKVSVESVYHTLFEAVILVLIVILLFLQDFRATLIPAITIPVSLIGTFGVMAMLGYSINTLTLFGLVLAIGIVVDDAILVVENTYRHMQLGAKSPKEATLRAMDEITQPIIGTILVLLSVFIPTAFMSGITGEMYRQFAVTIAVSTAISGFNALTLSPALCALVLKKKEKESNFFIYRYFNKGFDKLHSAYSLTITNFLRKPTMILLAFCAIFGLTMFGFTQLPTGFIPIEDQGYFMTSVELQNGASLNETIEVADKASEILRSVPGVVDVTTISGNSIAENAQLSNKATIFIVLENWDERTSPETQYAAIIHAANVKLSAQIENAIVYAFPMPAITGLGMSGGFEMYLQDKGDMGVVELQRMSEEFATHANLQPELEGVRSSFTASVPQYFLNINRDQIIMRKLKMSDVFDALSSYFGSSYVNDFVVFGKVFQVRVQAESVSRSRVEDITKISVRNADGDMVPFGAIMSIDPITGAEVIPRFNSYKAGYMSGNPASGYSSGQAQAAIYRLEDKTLGTNYGFEWTGMAYQEQAASSSIIVVFGLALILVLLVLAAQYESVTSPMAVIMAVPIALFGIVIASMLTGNPMNIYTQIGMVLMIALSAKNAILIVEFGRDYRLEGKSIYESSLDAGKIRLRPILMTSFAFILGVVPLVTATGAGAASRFSLGLSVLSGMLACTILGTMLVPNFYQFWETIQEKVFDKNEKEA